MPLTREQSVIILSVKFDPNQWKNTTSGRIGVLGRIFFSTFFSAKFWRPNFQPILTIFDRMWLQIMVKYRKMVFGHKPEVLPVLLRDPDLLRQYRLKSYFNYSASPDLWIFSFPKVHPQIGFFSINRVKAHKSNLWGISFIICSLVQGGDYNTWQLLDRLVL